MEGDDHLCVTFCVCLCICSLTGKWLSINTKVDTDVVLVVAVLKNEIKGLRSQGFAKRSQLHDNL